MNKDLKYLKQYKEITINQICKDLNITSTNLYSGKLHPSKIHEVRVELENRLRELNTKSRIYKSRRKRFRKKKGK